MNNQTIAARASQASGKTFFKSYIKDIQLVETRPIKDHPLGFREVDCTFSYKGNAYRINSYICPNEDGETKFSARFRYELVELGASNTCRYIVTYTARRKNAKRHVQQSFGRTVYFGSVEEAEQKAIRSKNHVIEIYTSKWEFVKEVSQ